jgi:abortive infection bacteriophage resistance protein
MRHGAFAHLDKTNFPLATPERHSRFVEDLRTEARRSSEAFVAHFSATYDEFPDLPIWAAGETMTFGSMLTLFKMSERRIQSDIARQFGIAGPVMLSWLQTLNYVRNICAHHSRLWNRELALKPMIPDAKHASDWHSPRAMQNNRVFVVLTILSVLSRRIAPQSGWRTRLYELFDRFPDVPVAQMGLPADWRNHPLWREAR